MDGKIALKKGQASVEMIIISGIVLTILTVTIALNQNIMSSISNQFKGEKARTVVDYLANTAELIYQEGFGAKTKVFVTMPDDLDSVSISEKTIKIIFKNGEVIYRNLDFNVSGSLPAEEGNQWVNIESKENYVLIGVGNDTIVT